jgi:hypothetical protein
VSFDETSAAVPRMINGFIDGSVNLFIRDISGFLRAPVQELFELLGNRRAIPGRMDLLRRNGSDAHFLVGVDGAAQELLDRRLHALR